MLVALHGFTGRASSWDRVLAAIEGRAFDLPGHGDRELDGNPVLHGDEFVSVCDAYSEQLAALRAPPWHLAGYSMGGRVALWMALRRPERVRRLTLIGTNPGVQDIETRLRLEREWASWLRRGDLAEFVRRWEGLPIFATQAPAAVKSQRATRLSHVPERLLRALELLGTGVMPSAWERLAELVAPVHLVAGELDEKYVDIHRRMARLIPDARTTVIPGCGHSPLVEAPLDLARLLSAG